MSEKFNLRRCWKPPFAALQFVVIILAVTSHLVSTIRAQSNEVDPDSIEIIVDRTPFSLSFSVGDAESFAINNVTCKDKNNLEFVGNDNNTCENLEPCSTYTSVISITKLLEENQPVVTATQDETTDYNKPEVAIVQIVPASQTIYLEWSSTSQWCISSFEIQAISGQSSDKYTVPNFSTYQVMEGLKPCQKYNITLKTTDIYKNLVSNLTADSETVYEEPDDVSMQISETANAQLQVVWSIGSHATCAQSYNLKWFRLDCPSDFQTSNSLDNITVFDDTDAITCQWSKKLSTVNEYIISGLQGCEDYRVELYVNSNATVKAQEITKSPEQVPGPVTIQSTDIGNTTVTLTWNPPKQHPKCVRGYYANMTGPEERPVEDQQVHESTRNDVSAHFSFLDPCGKYNYSIVAQSINGSFGSAYSSSLKTNEEVPSAVNNLTVQKQSFSLMVSWEPPKTADLCLANYRLVTWDDEGTLNFEVTTTNTSAWVSGLMACVGYVIQVTPVTATDNDGSFQQVESETLPAALSMPDVEVLAAYADRLSISAQESDKNNKCETIFARINCSTRSDVPIKTAEKYFKGQLGIVFQTDIGPLSPYTEYTCDTALFNIGGWSPSRRIVKWTEAYFPGKPENVSVKTNTNTTLAFAWHAPRYPNGVIKLYITYFQKVEAAYFIPSKCSVSSSDLKTRETSSLEQPFDELQPYTRYSVQVAAQNEFGLSASTLPTMGLTNPWISDPVTNPLSFPQGPSVDYEDFRANVIVSWTTPCKSNGEIEYFVLEFTGLRANQPYLQFWREVLPDFDNDGVMSYNETDLKPEYSYTVLVSVKNMNVNDLSPKMVTTFEAPAGIPRVAPQAFAQARVEAYENSNPSKTAVVRFPADVLESDFGTVIYVALLLSEKGCDNQTMGSGAMDTIKEWPDVKSWNSVNNEKSPSCIQQYQTTPLRWKPVTTMARSEDVIEYVIGTEDCVDTTVRYCNGPLKSDTEYNLVIRLFTKSGYNDAAELKFRTEAVIQLTLIIVGVSSCLLLALVAGFIYLWITKRIKWQRESCHGIEDSFGDIGSKNFALYYRELSKPEKIAREFKELTAVALDLSYSASEMGYNKNRYADIFPYDKNRVILDIDADGSDYINASFIDGYRRRKEYIATQGPKPESTMDFWRMVLQHNVRVIVMVTQFREGDVVKCHEYFPFQLKGIHVTQKKKDSFELYDRTELSVVHEMMGLKQKVVHLYFKKWPDHGCPTDPMHLINFIKKVKAEKVPRYSPIVVHCSAGVGRTGTFIGLDIIMQRLKNESKINIYETVKKLRFQRMKMVQTLAQYTFLYTCAFQLVRHKLKASDLKEEEQRALANGHGHGPVDAANGVSLRNQRNGSNDGSTDGAASDSSRVVAIPITYGGAPKEKLYDDLNSESVM